MRGFQPQKFADGGLVQGLKRVFGMDEERNARVAAYRAQAAQEKPAETPAPAPAPAVSDYAGMGAMKRREKAAGLADGGTVKPRGFKAGGLIRGPGTGTSDSIKTEKRPGTFIMPADSTQAIGPEALEEMGEMDDGDMEEQGEKMPVRLSAGEFELPPEQVQALGEAVLTVMRDATHKPVRGFAPQAETEEPRQFFADGGVVDDEQKKRLANQTSMYVQGAQAAAANRPPAPTAPPPAAPPPEPQAAFGVFPQMGRNTAGGRPAPAPVVPPPATEVEGWRTKAVMDGAAQDAQASWDRGGVDGVAGAAGAVARGAITAIPTAVGEFAYNTVAPLGGVARGFWNGITGGDSAPEAPATTQASPSPAAPRAPDAQGGQAPASGTQAAPPVQATAAPISGAAEVAASTGGNTGQVMPGVFRSGNSYSDSAQGVVNGAAPRGMPSAQNVAAADALYARQQQDTVPRVAGFQPTGITAPVIRNSTNDWAARNNLRNQAVSASSITNRPGWSGGGRGFVPPDVLSYQEALRADQALQQAQPGLDQTAMRENGGLQREAVQQAGGLQREQVQQAGANTRANASNAVDQRRVGLEEQVRGFDIREGQRKEQLFARYNAAKTAEEKAAVAQQIRDLSGKQPESPWKVQVTPTTKNADGSTTDGSVYRYNTQTGVVERVDAAATAPLPLPAKDQLKAGQVYQTPRGPARWDGKQFQTA
ncbi:hypothetical protein C380_08850 [Acidovorax sp. KKS102]|uniref:hypothetical protein n=1 Tax=Acidovorax sp. KKS102 TaxID=358220 RepID=UPI00028B273F|nr:hypothetical protein [Acidovorax sp. KKS102]AFU45472.1 hypothetical protein C380_08850 [Acidovorax sp. KKS102]